MPIRAAVSLPGQILPATCFIKVYIKTIQEGFDKYLDRDKPFFIPREYLSPQEAIHLIHQARGLAVLAHPLVYGMDISTLEKAVFHLAGLGLDGLEAYYSMNRGHDTVHMKTLAKKYRLVLSGGSDFHGDNKPHIKIGRGRGNLYVPAQILEQQKAYLSEKNSVRSVKRKPRRITQKRRFSGRPASAASRTLRNRLFLLGQNTF